MRVATVAERLPADDLPDGVGWIRLTLVKGDASLFHAFVYHYDTDDLVVVEPVDSSDVSQFSDAHDPDEHHRRIRAEAARAASQNSFRSPSLAMGWGTCATGTPRNSEPTTRRQHL